MGIAIISGPRHKNNSNHKWSSPIHINLLLFRFREAYYSLRTNTDEDATIMSWWDYGDQICGMANRLVFHFYCTRTRN